MFAEPAVTEIEEMVSLIQGKYQKGIRDRVLSDRRSYPVDNKVVANRASQRQRREI